mgnify:FL=1
MTDAPNKPQRLSGEARRSRIFAIGLGVSVCVGLIIGGVAGWSQDPELPQGPLSVPGVIPALALAGIAAVTWVSLIWWRTIDELARQAHATAWFWGGSLGMTAGWLALSFASVLPAPLLAWLQGSDAAEAAWRGGTVVAAAALAGYGLAWAAFWLRRR